MINHQCYESISYQSTQKKKSYFYGLLTSWPFNKPLKKTIIILIVSLNIIGVENDRALM